MSMFVIISAWILFFAVFYPSKAKKERDKRRRGEW